RRAACGCGRGGALAAGETTSQLLAFHSTRGSFLGRARKLAVRRAARLAVGRARGLARRVAARFAGGRAGGLVACIAARLAVGGAGLALGLAHQRAVGRQLDSGRTGVAAGSRQGEAKVEANLLAT